MFFVEELLREDFQTRLSEKVKKEPSTEGS